MSKTKEERTKEVKAEMDGKTLVEALDVIVNKVSDLELVVEALEDRVETLEG